MLVLIKFAVVAWLVAVTILVITELMERRLEK